MELLQCLGEETQGKLIQHMSGLQSGRSSLPRSYHNLEHVAQMQLALLNGHCSESGFKAMHLAVWFHDLYYDSRAPKGENEDKSCELVDTWFSTCRDLRAIDEADPRLKERLQRYIQRTKTHEILPSDEMDAHLNVIALAKFLRADLAVLSADERLYWVYLLKLRKEYGWASEADWRRGRIEFLEKMLDRPCILPRASIEQHETGTDQVTRANLRKELQLLHENKSYLQWKFRSDS